MLRSTAWALATAYQRLAPARIRITPAGAEAFEALLDRDTGRILENRFGSGSVGRELDYRRIEALWWPMRYEIIADGRPVRRGRFAEATVRLSAGLPALEVAAAPRVLPSAAAELARLLGAQWISTSANEYNLSLDAAQRLLVFARSASHFESARIMFARWEGARWSDPAEVPFTDPRYSDSDPWLTPDGKFLYFISRRATQGEAPRKDSDIWRVAVHATGFGTPEHLAVLNSDASELGPEVHDGHIYFNSSRKGGPARVSIYRARLSGAGFEKPEPLGAPFSDGEAQGDFTLSPDGSTAVFWSQRDGSSDGELFAARRIGEGWSKAVRLPSPLNAPGFDFTPSFSADGRELWFASMRGPAWLRDTSHALNGQSNVYVAPADLVERAFNPR